MAVNTASLTLAEVAKLRVPKEEKSSELGKAAAQIWSKVEMPIAPADDTEIPKSAVADYAASEAPTWALTDPMQGAWNYQFANKMFKVQEMAKKVKMSSFMTWAVQVIHIYIYRFEMILKRCWADFV